MSLKDEIEGLGFGEHSIEITKEEAKYLDWILTLHAWDERFLEWLMDERSQKWRRQAGEIILGSRQRLETNDEDLQVLLTIASITFRFDELDVGYSFKTKLYRAYLNIPEEKEAKNASQNKASDNPEDPPIY